MYHGIAKALYSIGKQEKNIQSILNAKNYLKKAQKEFPDDKSTLFNLALVDQQYALALTEQPLEDRSIEAMKDAIELIKASETYFLNNQ